MRYGEMEIEAVPPHVRSHVANPIGVAMQSMTGNTSKDNPVVPVETEPFHIRRKRELLCDLKFYDGGLASLHDAIGEARRESGLTIQTYLPTSAMGPRMRALMSGLNELSKWHSAALAELAPLP
jgi:hypothetical protein